MAASGAMGGIQDERSVPENPEHQVDFLQSALRHSEELTRAVIDSLAAHIAVLDPQGCIALTNAAWERFARENSPGTPVNTGVGVNYLEICESACASDAEGAKETLAALQGILRRELDHFHVEYPCHSPEQQRWFLLQANRLSSRSGGAVLLHINITERKLLEGKLLDHERLRVLTAGLLKGQEDERRRIARELHDGLNQQVASMAIELGMMIRQVSTQSPGVAEALKDLQKQSFLLSEQIRSISHQLHPASLDYLGLGSALTSYCDEFSKREGLRVQVKAADRSIDATPDVALCLFRVLQESLCNAKKHSGATLVRVGLRCEDAEIELRIVDNGVGFDPDRIDQARGLGFVSMEERAKLLGGRFNLSSRPGEGTQIEVRLPLNATSP